MRMEEMVLVSVDDHVVERAPVVLQDLREIGVAVLHLLQQVSGGGRVLQDTATQRQESGQRYLSTGGGAGVPQNSDVPKHTSNHFA